MLPQEGTNDVWSVLSKGVDAFKEYKLSRNSASPATTAAPSGSPAWNVFNPFPGTFGAYPQAEAKAGQVNSGGINLASAFPLLLLGAALILVVALFRR